MNNAIIKNFEDAVAQLQKNKALKLDNDQKLQLYALYKQSTEGDCKGTAPSKLKMVDRAKYDAWKALAKVSQEDAKKRYIDLVTKLNKGGQAQSKPKPKL